MAISKRRRVGLTAGAAVLVLLGGTGALVLTNDDVLVPPESTVELGWVEVPTQPWPTDVEGLVPLRIAESSSPDVTGTTVVNFWASTCAPCRHEMPLLARFARSSDFNVIGISLDGNG